eukprot:TRINITY_DN111868_c0_g1_i1.p1 TRINITY_DN111868_c0_g1~~TRINITY_DN111868_c0_g1_i1.p1  ORF type:complete len:322 (+),score=47.78 TRINITY_DN111868_c0_g1_i1:73-966(+)
MASQERDRSGRVDFLACLQKGLIGGIGAMPGTCGSHPFDVIKIRMQVNAEPLQTAINNVRYAKPNPGFGNFYRGFFPAIEQRMVTRLPMFLVSELFTQIVYNNTDFSLTTATFVGSCGSGFVTGGLAGIAEYRKKLLSQGVVTKNEARWGNLLRSAQRSGNMPALGRRLLAAGCCSATYDSVFFGSQRFLSDVYGYNPTLSYGFAAVNAVVAAFAFDSVVARMMVVPPHIACKSWSATLKELFAADPKNNIVGARRIVKGYRGLAARAVEFFVNYSITGFTSVYVIAMFTAVVGHAA